MPSNKAEETKPISVEFEGKIFQGHVVVRGSRFLEFIVHYGGRSKSDGRKYGTNAEERHNMMVMAEATLLQMVFNEQRA